MNYVPVIWLFLAVIYVGVSEITGECDGKPNYFTCKNSTLCIPASWRCDFDEDCDDGSDEEHCEIRTCTEDEFPCVDGKCIPLRWQCDSDFDCPDRSDETDHKCEKRTCRDDQFTCSTGQCIPMGWKCDEQQDCPNGEDEFGCHNATCEETEFRCLGAPHQCITMRWKCDHDFDCSDGSDEHNCEERACLANQFQCVTSGRCIPARWRCDNDNDCADNSDETDCSSRPPNKHTCSENEFQCNNLDCIHGTWKCDGDMDCVDESDESHCPGLIITCRHNEFRCTTSGWCVAGSLQCDGTNDCDDESDEYGCPTPRPECDANTQFDCGMFCIGVALLCDKSPDCAGGQDEDSALCDKEDPCTVNNGECSHYCNFTHVSHYCSCPDGFELDDGGKVCTDINECEQAGICSQTCNNTKGGFKCSCQDGYQPDPTNRNFCKAAEGKEPSLIFANRHDLREIKIDSGEFNKIVDDTRSAIALDFDHSNDFIYWSDVAQEKISRHKVGEKNISKAEDVISTGISTPDGIAIDWIHQNIYWTDTGFNSLSVYSLTKKCRKTLFNTNMDEPRAIVVDPRPDQRYIYWSDWGETPRIERAGMDGTKREAILQGDDLAWPNGMTIDYVKNLLFWVDAKNHYVMSSNLDGSNAKVVHNNARYLKHPFAITVFEDWIYWTDWETESIHKANKFGTGNITTVAHGLFSPMDIHVYHPLKQPSGPNYDMCVDNGGCSHLCLPSPRITARSAQYTCMCPDDKPNEPWELKDGLRCTKKHHYSVPPTKAAPSGTTGRSSNAGHQGSEDKQQGMGKIALVVVAILAVMVIAGIVIGCFVYRSYVKKGVRSMNFDNPVYRKTTEDQFSLEKNQYQPAVRDFPSALTEPLTANSSDA